MEDGILAYLIIVGVSIFGFYILIAFIPFGTWITARVSGVRITLLDLIYMKVRRIATAPIVKCMIMAAKAGIDIQKDALEAHSMSGGNVENVVTGMIIARNKNKSLSFNKACKMDLAGKDLSKEI